MQNALQKFYNLIKCVVKHGKMSLSKNRPQMSDLFRDATEGPIHV